jgi:hypothetical protein
MEKYSWAVVRSEGRVVSSFELYINTRILCANAFPLLERVTCSGLKKVDAYIEGCDKAE